MKTTGFIACGLMVTVLVGAALVGPMLSNTEEFTLIRAVPNDVFLCIAERNNPERDFVEMYWLEVFDALKESGISDDVIDLFSTLLGMLNEQQAAEIERLKGRVMELVAGVDWEDLAGKEFVFAEKMLPPADMGPNNPPILMAHMIWLFRGSAEGAAKNYRGLTAILDTLVDEINRAAGAQMLMVEKTNRMGAEVASVNLMNRLPGDHSLPVSVALRDDVILLGVRDQLFEEALALLDGSGSQKALADDPRFKNALAQLPAPEDLISFFDMQAMLKPMRITADKIISKVIESGDVIINSAMPAEINGLSGKATTAYQSGDVEKALSLTQDAYDIAPKNSIILYNLACFNALAGNKDAALAWLDRAVEAGFYAPRKIATDADLASLKGEVKFEQALQKATELSIKHTAKDACINYAGEGEVMRLRMQVIETYETADYERGLELIKQAYALDPRDSKVVYTMACLHALLGHEEESLKYLDQAVDVGFYCPGHMSRDADLESVRSHERFKAAMAKAKVKAGELAVQQSTGTKTMVKRIVDRLMNAVGILDCTATVETTEGYTTTAQTVVMMAPDAKERPIYAIFGSSPQTDFDRYLPAETLSFSVVGGINASALYTFIEDTIRLAGQPGEEALAKWNAIQAQLGFDVRRDLTDWIQGDSISVTLEDGGGNVTLIKVNDEKAAKEKISAAIEFTTTKLRELISQKRELAGLAMLSFRTSPVKHDELEGFKNIYFSMVPEPGVWGVKDGYLIFGSSADAIALVLATARGDHPNIRTNERAMSEALVPSGPFAAVTLSDMRGLGEEMEQGLGIASMVATMMSAAIPEPEVRPVVIKISGLLGKLAPVVRKIDFYKSSSTLTTSSDGLTWHTKSVTNYFSPEERAAKDM